MKKKFLAVILLLCLAVGLACHAEAAAGDAENIQWSYDSATKTLTFSGTGEMKDYSVFGSLPPWHDYYDQAERVVIGEGITRIGSYAFWNFHNLTELPQTKSLTSMGYKSFGDCSGLKTVQIPQNVTSLEAAFVGCRNLSFVSLPEGLTDLELDAFSGTAVKSLTLPASLTNLEGFYLEESPLETISVAAGNESYRAVDGVLYSADGTELIAMPQSRTGSFTVPEGVTSIAGHAFGYSGLSRILLPDSLETIDAYAFAYCRSLTEITLPEGITELAAKTFHCCENLKTVHLPGSLEKIGDSAFMGTALESVVIPPKVKRMDYDVFAQCSGLKQVIFLGDAPGEAFFSLGDDPGEDLVIYYPEGALGWEDTWLNRGTQAYRYTCSGTATCTTAGTLTYSCEELGLQYTMFSQALGHDLGEFTLVKKATTASAGQWNRVCARCGVTETITIPKLAMENAGSADTYNRNGHNYRVWGSVTESYLEANEAGYLRVEPGDGFVTVEQYTKDFALTSQFGIAMELPLFGGYYTDGTCRYLVFGQENDGEDDNVEVFRVVRYSMDWQRMDCASIYGASTTVPFDGGGLDMASSGDFLYVHTCHKMYTHNDGLRHQANFTFVVHIPTMEVLDISAYGIGSGAGYVSHSFNQYILLDGKRIITLDHGDGYPRAADLILYPENVGSTVLGAWYSDETDVYVLEFFGPDGLNGTNASLGGLEVSSTHYLTVGNSTKQTVLTGEIRNIYISATSREDFSEAGTAITWVTAYPDDSGVEVSTPFLVKLGDDSFLILWTEGEELCYVFADGTGKVTSQTYRTAGQLSDCQPIVSDGKVVWYVTRWSGELTFYALDLAAPGTVTTASAATVELEVSANPFTDVQEGAYYYDAVLWAVGNGITTGKTETTFDPKGECTRKQVVTFLWRAAGEPEPTVENPFTDIPEGKYYTDAVLWAYENGITTGTSATEFSPEATCTRKQIATFLYRYFGQPEVSGVENPFTDVKSDRFENAILWAYSQGITTGKTETTFQPEATCTRNQIVAFLYRAMA